MTAVYQAGTTSNMESVFMPAHGFTAGTAIYWNGATWQKAIATSATTSAMGVVASVEPDAFNVVFNGSINYPAHGLTAAGYYYLSPTVAGGVQVAAPTGPGEVVQTLFKVQTPDVVQVLGQGLSALPTGGGVRLYAAGETYTTGEFFSYNDMIYRVIATFSPAPAAPPPANVAHQAKNYPNTGAVYFGSATRQMINLYGTSYGIGIQSSSMYFRTGGNFYFHRGGGHNDAQGNPGGGVTEFQIRSNGTSYIRVCSYNAGARPTPSSRELVEQAAMASAIYVSAYSGRNGYQRLSNKAIAVNQYIVGCNISLAASGQIDFAAHQTNGASEHSISVYWAARSLNGIGSASLVVVSQRLVGTKIFNAAYIHYSGGYRISFRVAAAMTVNIGSFTQNTTYGQPWNAGGLGTTVALGTNYGGVGF